MLFLGLDIGTTRMKCGIYNENGRSVYYDSCDYGTRTRADESYIDIEAVLLNVRDMLKRAYSEYPFDSIAISSLGESFVLLDEDDRILFSPMLYTDPRGELEAEALSAYSDKIFAIAGVVPQGMYSAYKLLWIKNNHPELYEKADKLLLVGEYIGYMLTGKRAIDNSLAARTGVFDVRRMEFSRELCELFGIRREFFSPAVQSGEIIAPLSEDMMKLLGAEKEILLIAGGHDQICAAIGTGAVEDGICSDGMGTVECLTVPYGAPMESAEMGLCGYPNVPHGVKGLWCTYLLNYSCGSLLDWWMDTAFGDVPKKDRFSEAEKDFSDEPTGLLVLPYFAGASTPYQNINAAGGIVNLRLSDTPSKIYQGIIEGLAMEMKLNLELTSKHGVMPKKIIATGGCSASDRGLRIKADILGLPIYRLKLKEAGICGCAILSAARLLGEEISAVAKRFSELDGPFLPNRENSERYAVWFEKYKELYMTIKKFY